MHILNAQSPELFELASKKLGGQYSHERGERILSAVSRGEVIGQAVFSDISPGMKAEVGGWFERGGLAGRVFLRAVFTVAFVEWKCKRLTAVTRESNHDAQRALVKMGFKFEASLEAWFGDEPGWMFRMLAAECRWLKER